MQPAKAFVSPHTSRSAATSGAAVIGGRWRIGLVGRIEGHDRGMHDPMSGPLPLHIPKLPLSHARNSDPIRG
jgi:hypothetical protein